ncbi:unnamed protein product, partial [Staurois parvus]
SGFLQSHRAVRGEKKLHLQALTSALLDTDISYNTALAAHKKIYLAIYIYENNCISMFCVLWETRYSECRVLGLVTL